MCRYLRKVEQLLILDCSGREYPLHRRCNPDAKLNRASANAIPAAGWAVTHIAADSSLLRRIRVEIAPAFSSDSVESVDVTKLNASQLLQSVVAEVLRLRVSALINRVSFLRMSSDHY